MLMAAIAVSESGPDALKDIPDPFGNGPFAYAALEDGFELRSQLVYEGKPVSLTIGRSRSK
jgi:hypothetical protein